jgi:tetratricopeptide (TPR) repeat protein
MGRVVDARADQFAFCITLWEALYGQRPYAGKTSAALAAAVSAGQIVAPTSERGVPRRIRSILARGLAPSPRDRWPDMPSLVRALRDEPGRRRRWLGVGGALLTAGVAGAWWFGTQEACVGASEELAKAWNEERQQHVQAAFESADLPYGAQTFERVTQELDSWSAAWIASHRETCLSSQRQEQSPARLDARMRCLMAARQDLAATVDVLEKADREVVDRGLDLVWALPRPQRCERAQAENDSAILPSPEQQTAVEDLRAQLAAATAAKVAGQYERAIELALDVQTRAGEVGFEPLVLQAQAQHGELLELTGHPKRAREVFDGVLRDCVEREMWGVCTSVALQQIYVAGYRLSELQAALVYANLARAFNAKAQRDGVDVRVAVNLGSAYQRVGEPEEALSQFERAAELAASDPSVDASIRLQAETNRAFMLMELERLEDAESELRKIIEMRTAEFGADHPITSGSHINLGLFLAEHGRAAEGVKALERGLQIRVARLGPDHPLVASARIQLGAGLVAAGEDERAFDEFRRGYEATKKALGADHPQTAEALGNLSAQAFDAQDYEAAAEYTRTAIAALEASRGADTASTHLLHHNLGVIYREMGNLPAAEVELRDALERENRTVEAPAERGHTEHYLGLVLYEQGRLEEALAVLQRARAKNARPEVSNPRKADTLFALARVQLDAGRDRAEARALAEEARELLRDEDASETKAEIDAWLAAN